MTPKQKKKHLLIAILLLVFAGVKIAALLNLQYQQWLAPAPMDCEITSPQGCTFSGSQTFYLQGVGGNKTPFSAVAANLPEATKSVSVSFEMDGMDMGFNQFDLTGTGNGNWRVDKIYLPLCTSDRHDWTVKWHIDGRTYSAPFQTQPQ